MRWLFRSLTIIGIAVLYYLAFSLFFDTPIERELKNTSSKLETSYEKLAARYDTLMTVLQNIEARDRNVYQMLFEAEPYDAMAESDKNRIELYEKLLDMSNIELTDELIGRFDKLDKQIGYHREFFDTLEYYIVANSEKINGIPSIQPITNKDLTLLTASFGDRIQPFYKTIQFHGGVDYAVPVGTAVFATADGYVSEIQNKRNATGLSMKLLHDSGYETVYNHLDKTLVLPGRYVHRGDVIATVGNSGMSMAPHLHYEVRHKGHPVDPTNYFFIELDAIEHEKIKAIARSGMQSLD